MSYQIEALPNFKRELKRLKKKYPSLLHDVAELAAALAENPTQGKLLQNPAGYWQQATR